MKLLAFSDLHRDLDQAAKLVEMSADADVVIGAGDFASMHEGLEETIGALAPIETPTILVPGNNETVDALRGAAAGWPAATVLHGEGTTIDGARVLRPRRRDPDHALGLELRPLRGGRRGDDRPGARRAASWSSTRRRKGHCDGGDPDTHFGSEALLAAVEEKQPRLVVFGHIHEAWGCESTVGDSPLRNLGPSGTWIEI